MPKTRLLPTAAIGASILSLGALAAPPAHAQSVEFRIIERTGRTTVTGPTDAELNFAVQARVVGASGPAALGAFGFNIHIVGEPESGGTLARGLISNLDHTYATDLGTSAAVGRGGLASTYTYLGAINPSFNGVINQSSGTFSNGPDQEIGLITGSAFGAALLNTPGMDADSDGNPDTWSGNGSGTRPVSGTTADIPEALALEYFGASGTWIDVYRFRYTVATFASRSLTLRLEAIAGTVCTSMTFANGAWGASGNAHPPITATNLLLSVATAPVGACCDSSGTCSLQDVSACTGAFLPASACDPNPCPPSGRCCTLSGACTMTLQSFCNNVWTLGETCGTTICPGPSVCCSASGVCTIVLQSLCSGIWSPAGTCTPSPCPGPGACCTASGGCLFITQSACTSGYWGAGATCTPTGCTLGACCTVQSGCVQTTGPACAGIWAASTSCSPIPCVLGGCCDPDTGDCAIADPAACSAPQVFLGVSVTCAPAGTCPSQACCSALTHACTVVFSFESCAVGTSSSGIGSTCVPNICPGIICCSPTTGVCAIIGPSGTCIGDRVPIGSGTSCNPFPCVRIACCNTLTGSCSTIGPAGTCPVNSVSQGLNSSCGTVTCPTLVCCNRLTGVCTLIGPAGTCPADSLPRPDQSCFPSPCPTVACCNTLGICTLTGPSGSCPADSTPLGSGVCVPNPCPPAGRCCAATGACTRIIQAACVGTWSIAGSCSPNSCPQPGRCCTLSGACSLTLASACTDIWSETGSCTPNICGQYGACCHEGTSCSLKLQSACFTGTTSFFRGPGTSCGTPANPIGCCLANFDMVGGVDVNDLYAFIAAWFAHDPAADFDRNGTLNITDVMRFITAWTAGCH